jgi:hypothetical protein
LDALPKIIAAANRNVLEFVTISVLAEDIHPRRRMARRALAVAIAVPVLALLGLVVLDLATGASSHFSRSVLHAHSFHDVIDIGVRRLRLSGAGIGRGTMPISIGISVALLVCGVIFRRRLLAPLDSAPDGGRAFRAGLAGSLAATVVGALANDSGPVMLFIGTVALLLAVGYVRGGHRLPVRQPAEARV